MIHELVRCSVVGSPSLSSLEAAQFTVEGLLTAVFMLQRHRGVVKVVNYVFGSVLQLKF